MKALFQCNIQNRSQGGIASFTYSEWGDREREILRHQLETILGDIGPDVAVGVAIEFTIQFSGCPE